MGGAAERERVGVLDFGVGSAKMPRMVMAPTAFRVLIVDDDVDMREALTEFFRQKGLTVVAARDGREAVGVGWGSDAGVVRIPHGLDRNEQRGALPDRRSPIGGYPRGEENKI